jgi:hypothetical protein
MPDPLTLLKIAKSDLDLCSKQLIRLAFFKQSTSSFFSYTETEEEVSLILDEGSRKELSSLIEELQIQSQQWRAIEIFEGPQAIDQTGYIARFSEPLARQHVDLIYVSTYNTDLILVTEEAVERAVVGLQQVALDGLSTPSAPQSLGTEKMPRFASEDDLEAIQGDAAETHILAKLENHLHLVNFATSQVPALTHCLLQLFLFPQSPARFFSYTSYGGQVSLILDSLEFDSLRPHLSSVTHHEHLWNAIHIQASAEGIDSGVVNFAARLLADSHIPIYYLATSNDDFILVPQQSSTAALASLQGLPPPGPQTPEHEN